MTRFSCRAALLGAFALSWLAGLNAVQAEDAKPTDKADAKPVRMLFLTYSGGFKHGSVNRKDGKPAPAEAAMAELGVKSNLFRVDATQDPKDINQENLKNYDLVMFYTTGKKEKWPVKDEDWDYLFNTWLKTKGHGFIGAHSAADTLEDYKPYWDMIGGSFNGHPWGSGETVTVTVHEPDHPIAKPWGSEFTIKDEIYQFKNWQPEKVHVLMSLDMSKTKLKKPYLVPIAWCKEYGDGKAFHMSLGHNEAVWVDPRYQESLLGGIKWILGQEKGEAKPNPELSQKLEAKAKADYEAAGGDAANKKEDKKPAAKAAPAKAATKEPAPAK